ncbi:MAG: GGDEF domain-containing protein [Cellulosilyticaceae bacterium]
MNLFPSININIAAMIILSILLFLSHKKRHCSCNQQHFKIFSWLTTFTLIILILEVCSLVLELNHQSSLILLSLLVNTLGFILAPIITLILTLQLKTWLSLPYRLKPLCIPVFLNLIVCVINMGYPLIFSITQTNAYHRMPFFLFPPLCCYIYIAYNLILLIRHRHQLSLGEFMIFVSFVILPSTASLVQVFDGTILISWSACAVGLILFYIYLQEFTLTQDALTHAQNRLGFETKVNCLLNNYSPSFAMVLIDLDEFKSINDIYGHLEGDHALITLVHLIKITFHHLGSVFRIGGDEFVIIVATTDLMLLEQKLKELTHKLNTYNSTSNKHYKIKFSYGYDAYDSRFTCFDDYMTHLDMLMYDQKNIKKNIN